MSWNTAGALAARLYNFPLMLPWAEFVSWLIIATTPAKAGAPTEVPPTTVKPPPLDRNPLTQLPPEHIRYPSWAPDAFREMSGTSRALSLGTPLPVCQLGFE